MSHIQLIVRADDIGYSEAVNYGIEKSVKEGIVRSAGLMPNMPAAAHGLKLLEGTGTGLQAGRQYTLSFSGDYYGQIDMTLERISLEEEKTLAVFSCRSHLADTAMLRVQTVDVVTQQLEGIRIPRKALRVETVEETAEDGSIRHVNRYGVFTVVGAQAEWHEVEVLYTDESYYLVRPADPADTIDRQTLSRWLRIRTKVDNLKLFVEP